MCYSEEQIKRYLKYYIIILIHQWRNRVKRVEKINAGIAKEMIVLLFTQDLKFVKLWWAKWSCLVCYDHKDNDRLHFERGVFISESIIMRKRLIK